MTLIRMVAASLSNIIFLVKRDLLNQLCTMYNIQYTSYFNGLLGGSMMKILDATNATIAISQQFIYIFLIMMNELYLISMQI